MRRFAMVAGALVLLGGGLRAQDDSLEKIQKDTTKLFSKVRKIEDIDQKQLLELIDRMQNFGVDHKTEPTGFQGFEMALNEIGYVRGNDEKVASIFSEVMDALVENYVNTDRMASIVMGVLSYPPADSLRKKADEYRDSILRESKSPSVKCAGEFLALRKVLVVKLDPKALQAHIAKYEALNKKYGELEGPNGKWSQVFEEPIADLKVIGAPADEIDGKDLDGVPFKLSEYRGKAVLLDFWGMW